MQPQVPWAKALPESDTHSAVPSTASNADFTALPIAPFLLPAAAVDPAHRVHSAVTRGGGYHRQPRLCKLAWVRKTTRPSKFNPLAGVIERTRVAMPYRRGTGATIRGRAACGACVALWLILDVAALQPIAAVGQCTSLSCDTAVNASIENASEVDCFTFSAANEGEIVDISVEHRPAQRHCLSLQPRRRQPRRGDQNQRAGYRGEQGTPRVRWQLASESTEIFSVALASAVPCRRR
jgi:hypothetical protein